MLEQWLGRPVACHSLKLLTGGCCTTVLEATFARQPSPVVLKVDHRQEQAHDPFCDDAQVLRYIREHTSFPVPEPFHHGTVDDLAFLIMERLPGRHLGQAALSMTPRQRVYLQQQMAEAVAELHTHTAERFGSLRCEQSFTTWVEFMHAELHDLWQQEAVGRLLGPEAMRQANRALDSLPRLLDAPAPPTLSHGDLWATNIMVHQGRLSGFVDPCGHFMHPEYELAYLELFHTADEEFFARYHRVHPRMDGYERRRLVYWLSRLALHVWLFQTDNYVRSTLQVLSELDA